MGSTVLRLLVFGSIILAACSPQAPTAAPAAPAVTSVPQRSANQIIKVASSGFPGSMSPEASTAYMTIYNTIYDTLIFLDEGFAIKPQAAEKWEFTNGVWRFTLRKDLTFTDGTALTAEDVAFSLNNIADRNLPQRTYLPSIQSAKAIDSATVEVSSRTPDAGLINGLAWAFIFPKAYYEKIGRDAFQVTPMGSGPYELVTFQPSATVIVKKKATEHPFRKPIATEVRFQAVPDQGSIVNGMRTGDIDVVVETPLTEDRIAVLEKEGIRIQSLLSANLQVVAPQFEHQQRGTPLTDKRVRQALNYAIDRESIGKNLYGGRATPVGQLSTPSSPTWLKDVPAWTYDPKKAKELLAAAGYPNGFSLAIGIAFSPATNSQLVLAVQSYFREIGVDVPATQYESAQFSDRVRGINGQVRPDMIFIFGNEPTGNGSGWRSAVDCAAAPTARYWCNEDFTRLLNESFAQSDIAKRTELQQQAQRAILADVPFTSLLVTPQFVVHSAKIQGVKYPNPVFARLDDVYRVD